MTTQPTEPGRRRPRALTEDELGFKPRRAVRWLQPGVLVATGLKSLLAEIFGSYADKRELQGSLPQTVLRHDDGDELWFDFVADLGDGFDATLSVASLLAADAVTLPDGLVLPRGRLLVMGGDEVYPSASTRAYEDRSKGVYRAALPGVDGAAPVLFAVPGNHDWYDGLSAFLRVFAQRRPFGGWATEQTRSYFAVQLPQRWWLLAIDTQFDNYVDAPQLDYFRAVSAQLQPGDSVILCTATPSWVPAGSGGETQGYDTVEFLLREVVRSRGAQVRLMLSGDTHHYARFAEHGGTGQRVTCGLGGAYLAATHLLPERLVLPPALSRVRRPPEQTEFHLAHRYPAKAESRRLPAGILRLPWRNPGFWWLTGGTQLVLTLAMLLGLVHAGTGVFDLLQAWSPAVVVSAGMLLAGVAFARIETVPRPSRYLTAGLLHGLVHLALCLGWAALALTLYHHVLPRGAVGELLVTVIVLLGTPLLVGFVAAEVVAGYLLVASRFGINLNEVFAGQSIEDYKGFLRMHLAADGTLTVYPIKLDRVCHAWQVVPDGAPADPWVRPRTPLHPELIEQPFVIPPAG